VRHIRASFDFIEPERVARLHERIGDLTAGDTGLEEYAMALQMYEASKAPVDDRLRALAGMLMVATRWTGSLGDRPSDQWMADLRAKGRELLSRATNPWAIGRFLAADAFFPFWIQAARAPTPEELAEAESNANRAIAIARVLDNPELESVALDALAGCAQAVNDWVRARDTALERIKFEDKLGLYERVDAHSMVAWTSFLMGDLATAERDSAEMVARMLPGQAPYPGLHLFAWRALTLFTLGRWDDAAGIFWRAIDAWHDSGSHAAGYGLRGFVVGFDIGRARGDARLTGAATSAIDSILARFPPGHINRFWGFYVQGDVDYDPDTVFPTTGGMPPEMVERRISLVCDLRRPVPEQVRDVVLERAVQNRIPLLEGQIRRARALGADDAEEMSRAVEIFERLGAVPQLGRARAERGLLMHDAAETDEGLAILKKLGDVNYLDRFAARV